MPSFYRTIPEIPEVMDDMYGNNDMLDIPDFESNPLFVNSLPDLLDLGLVVTE